MGTFDYPTPAQQRYPIGTPVASGRNTGVSVSAAGTFNVTAGGRRLKSSVIATNAPMNMGQAAGFTMQIGGNGADNDTANYRIWLIEQGFLGSLRDPASQPTDQQWSYYGGGAITLSTAVGVGVDPLGLVLDSERMADTLTFVAGTTSTTPLGIGDIIATAYSSPAVQVYSPANNTPGWILVPRIGWPGGICIDFDQPGFFALIALK